MPQAVGFKMILDRYKELNDFDLFFNLNKYNAIQREQLLEAIEYLIANNYAENFPIITSGHYNVSLKPEAISYLEVILP